MTDKEYVDTSGYKPDDPRYVLLVADTIFEALERIEVPAGMDRIEVYGDSHIFFPRSKTLDSGVFAVVSTLKPAVLASVEFANDGIFADYDTFTNRDEFALALSMQTIQVSCAPEPDEPYLSITTAVARIQAALGIGEE